MKLPIPKIKLPKISLPFLKKKGGGDDDDFDLDAELDDQLDDDEDGDQEIEGGEGEDESADVDGDDGFDEGGFDDDVDVDGPSKGQKVKAALKKAGPIALTVFGALFFFALLGGVGGIVGWLYVNGNKTAAGRDAIRPYITVPILAEGEQAEPNSSLDNLPQNMAMSDSGDSTGESSETPSEEMANEGAGEGQKPDSMSGSKMPKPPPGAKGLAAVDPALLDEVKGRVLPIVAADGRQSWSTYGKPFKQSVRKPMVAILLTNLGLNTKMTEAAIIGLSPSITLSFSPVSENISDWVELSRKSGHETFLDLPMEPVGYPRTDPGPRTLLASLDAVENLDRLDWVLSQAQGYVGVVTRLGSQFTTLEEPLLPMLEALKERGLMIVDSRDSSRSIAIELASSIQLPRVYNTSFVDDTPNGLSIDRKLAELELIAKRTGYALGVARPFPVTLNRLANWSARAKSGDFDLAPVSALADKQRLR